MSKQTKKTIKIVALAGGIIALLYMIQTQGASAATIENFGVDAAGWI
jgi:hypothetical protein